MTDRMKAYSGFSPERPADDRERIGPAIGASTDREPKHGIVHGRAGRVMGAANRVNFAVTRLEHLGLCAVHAVGPTGMSGSAYEITAAGRAYSR